MAGTDPIVLDDAKESVGRIAFCVGSDLGEIEFQNDLSYLQTMSSLNLATEDAREGLRARREKRPTQWSGQ